MFAKRHLFVPILPLLLAAPALAAQGPPADGPPRPVPARLTVTVDCDAGDSLAAALAERADELTVEFTGTCQEEVLIRRDRTRLVGAAPGAEIVGDPAPAMLFGGVVTVLGASDVTLADFTVRGGQRGITLSEGSHARLERVTARDNERDGVYVSRSQAWVEALTAVDNGNFGLAVWGSSSVLFAPDAVTVASRNRVGLLVSGSSDLAGFLTGEVHADDNDWGLAAQLGASVQVIGLRARRNRIGLWSGYNATVTGPAEVRDSREVGAYVTDGGFAAISGTLQDNSLAGIWGEHAGTVTFSGSISGHHLGMVLDGTEAYVRNATVGDPVDLRFGTRVDFAGGNSFSGGISCDASVLVRGDVACPPPAATAPARAAAASGPQEAPAPPPPFRLEP